MEIQIYLGMGSYWFSLLVGAVLFGIFYFVVYSPTQDEISSIVEQSESCRMRYGKRKGIKTS